MKTSLTETKQIEAHLFQTLGEEALVFEARLILEPGLYEKTVWQQKTYALVQDYGRRKLRAELEAVHQKLFSEVQHETFRQKILRIFSNP